MSLDPPTNPFDTEAPENDTQVVDGLERAVAQARSTLPDHDNSANVILTSPSENVVALATEAQLAFDSSAVMDVLRGAIARYATVDTQHGDGQWVGHGKWENEFPVAASTASETFPAFPAPTDFPERATALPTRHAAARAGYAPDRRKLAAVVVVLFALVGGLGYQQLASGKSSTVKTVPTQTVAGRGVTTLPRPVTSGVFGVPAPPDTGAAPPPETAGASAPAGTVKPPPKPGTPPPVTDPPPTTAPPTTGPWPTTTTQPPTTTTEPPTTTTEPPTTTTTEPPTTTTCAPDPC